MLLPIGPKELFVASNDTGYQERLRQSITDAMIYGFGFTAALLAIASLWLGR